MRGLKRLIPEDLQNSLNSSPTFQWVVTIFFAVIGIFLIVKGVRGVINKSVTDKRGKVYEGGAAQVLGAIYAILGLAIATIAVVLKAV